MPNVVTTGLLRGIVILSSIASLVACSSASSIRKSENDKVSVALETADDLLGTPYCWAGTTPDCFDCSGFVSYCFDKGSVPLPRTSRELYLMGQEVNQDELLPGDLVFFRTNGKSVSHVGMYIGRLSFIHSSTSKGVMISGINDRYWGPRYLGARRVVLD